MEACRAGGPYCGRARILWRRFPGPLHVGLAGHAEQKLDIGRLAHAYLPGREDEESDARNSSDTDSVPPPGILAKLVATLDVISSGRAILGVGAGWSKTEFEGYSEWNDPEIRVDKTEEGVQLIQKLWHDPTVNFDGKYYEAKNAVLEPEPAQKPHPPLLFGGVGKRMLRLGGRYGDMCFIPPWVQNTTFVKAKEIVEKEAERTGRKGKVSFGAGSPRANENFDLKQVRKDVETAENNGCNFYIMPFPQGQYVDALRAFARDVLPSYSETGRRKVQAELS